MSDIERLQKFNFSGQKKTIPREGGGKIVFLEVIPTVLQRRLSHTHRHPNDVTSINWLNHMINNGWDKDELLEVAANLPHDWWVKAKSQAPKPSEPKSFKKRNRGRGKKND